MIRIILTRHGETLWNLEGRVQGVLDSPLTEKGIEQARLLASRIRNEKIKLFYTSDQNRAISTADVIRKELNIKAPIITNRLLRELSFGEWEGKVWSELRKIYPEIFKIWETEPHSAQIPGGETMSVVYNRVWSFMEEIMSKHQNETICIVTHGLTLKLLITRALGFAVCDWKKTPWQYNTSLNILEIQDNKITPKIIGDCTHLDI